MKERPILFSGEMVRAILDGRKKMTRRIVKTGTRDDWNACPYGGIGDRLWVRETWADVTKAFQSYDCEDIQNVAFRADGSVYVAGGAYLEKLGDSGIFVKKWKPSIFLPRYASRITLEITNIRVERLHSISEADAEKEGCERMWPMGNGYYGGSNDSENPSPMHTCRGGFQYLWDCINGKRALWESNPWVWVIEFKRVEGER